MDCIFCKIIKREIPSKDVYEDDFVKAFYDINPKAPVHVLIVPKKHINPAQGFTQDEVEIIGNLFLAAQKIAEKEGVFQSGFRLITNSGPDSGQEIEHLHFHLLGGKPLGGLVGN